MVKSYVLISSDAASMSDSVSDVTVQLNLTGGAKWRVSCRLDILVLSSDLIGIAAQKGEQEHAVSQVRR